MNDKLFHVTEPVQREWGLSSEYKVFLRDSFGRSARMDAVCRFLNEESTYGGPVGRADYYASDSPDFPSNYWVFQGSRSRNSKLSRDELVAKLAKLLEK